jgi:hypothetical protein
VNVQPDWLKETVCGLTTSHLYTVYLERRTHAVVRCPGHNGYINRMDGVKYAPVHYVLVEKGKNYWSHTWKELHTGRVTKLDRIRMQRELDGAVEASKSPKN